MGLSILGIFHTIVGIIAIIAAVVSCIRYGKISLAQWSGKIYFYGTVITAVTALGFTKHGFNLGHILSILVLLLVLGAYFLHSRRDGNNKARYFENFFLSFSFFLSWVPTVNETFTRIPVGHPLATDITDPLIGKTLLVILLLFIVGSVFQFIKQRKVNTSAA